MIRRVRHILTLALSVLLILAVSGVVRASESGGELHWGTDIRGAFRESKESGKPVLVDIWAVWCVPCKQMDETTYRDPEVLAGAENYILLKVDADLQETFLEKHKIDAFPTVQFLDDQAGEILRIEGLVGPDRMIEAMRAVHAGYAGYRGVADTLGGPSAAEAAGNYLLSVGNPGGAADLLKRAARAIPKTDEKPRERLELMMAEAQLADSQWKASAKTFERLYRDSQSPEVKGRALAGLSKSWRGRGNDEKAESTLAQLRSEFPEVAADLETAGH